MSDEPIRLLVRDVAKAVLKTAAEGRLGYQQSFDVHRGSCCFRYSNGACCAIGAALSDDEVSRLRPIFSIGEAIYGGYVVSDDHDVLQKIQIRHDRLVSADRIVKPRPKSIAEYIGWLREISGETP